MVVTSANQVQLGLVANLDALVVMGQGHLDVVLSVIEFEPYDSVSIPVILKNVLGIFF